MEMSKKLFNVKLICVFSLIVVCLVSDSDAVKITLDTVKVWADSISGQLNGRAKEPFMSMRSIRECYQNIFKQTGWEKPDVGNNIKRAANNISKMLSKRIAALKESVKVAENKSREYQWSETTNGTTYVNSKTLKYNDPRLKHSTQFKTGIIENDTSVHIPVEIYDGKIEIKNGLKWTSDLVHVFKENRRKDPTLLWQYFGSQAGFVRTYPGKRWVCQGPVDLYDVRRRSWYTQGSSSPKDMLILIDTSGSVHGQALQLIKVSVSSLLDTLGDNDFVNIVKFSKNASHVGCFDTFVQANKRNKEVLNDAVKQLAAKGMADFKEGLTFAFKEFEKFRANNTNNQGARCNEVIMLLTDGGSDTVEEVFKKYNEDKRVRIFTYTIGPTASPIYSAKWMACFNRGYFSAIPAMGAIRSKVQEYLLALKAVKETSNSSDIQWTATKWTPGLGLMTTVTLPVYNRTKNNKVNQTILGVMATDVSIDQMKEHLRDDLQLGVMSYAFTINSNGYILFHPNQRAQHGWLDDPPNVDLLDVEYETKDITTLREHIINNASSDAIKKKGWGIANLVLSPSFKYLTEAKRRYFYEEIKESDFKLAVAVREYEVDRPVIQQEVTGPDLKKIASTSMKKKLSATFIPKWPYYKGFDSVDNKKATLEHLLSQSNPSIVWDRRLMNYLKFDLECMRKWENFARLTEEIRSDNETVADMSFPNITDDGNMTISNESLASTVTAPTIFSPNNSARYTTENMSNSSSENITEISIESTANDTTQNTSMYELITEQTTLNTLMYERTMNDTTQNTSMYKLTTEQTFNATAEVTHKSTENSMNTSADNVTDDYSSVVTSESEFDIKMSEVWFMTGASGLTKVFPKKAGQDWKAADPSQQDHFQKAMDAADDTFVFGTTRLKGTGDPLNDTKIVITKAVVIKGDVNDSYKPAVLGAQRGITMFQDILTGVDPVCADDDKMACYLLDDGAYVIASNKEDATHVGKFLGDVDCVLMKGLENKVFNKIIFYDFQGACQKLKPETSSSIRLLPHLPSLTALFEMLTLNWWSSHLSWAFVNFNLFSWLTTTSEAAGNDTLDSSTSCPEILSEHANHSCTIKRTLFARIDGVTKFQGVANDSTCIREFFMSYIAKTNLILVVAEKVLKGGCRQSCGQTYESLVKRDENINTENSTICKMPTRYRKRPEQCYNKTSDENGESCGTMVFHASTLLILFTFLLVILTANSLTHIHT